MDIKALLQFTREQLQSLALASVSQLASDNGSLADLQEQGHMEEGLANLDMDRALGDDFRSMSGEKDFAELLMNSGQRQGSKEFEE